MCILSPMRWTISILLSTALIAAAGSALFGACEETLEVCPPCGHIEDGMTDITGEIRIDRTFAAVQALRRQSVYMSNRAADAVAALRNAFNAIPEGDETELEALTRAVQSFLDEENLQDFGASIAYGACAVNRNEAQKLQNICEDLSCNIDRPNDRGLCRGLLTGSCDDPLSGTCFKATSAPCNQSCTGTCEEALSDNCPGSCVGTCDGLCLAHAADGSCQGGCDGLCTGTCIAETPFTCSGTCVGACAASLDAGCDETDTFTGVCNSTPELGRCTGQFYPEGCGAKCSGCSEAAMDCREVSKFAAWSGLTCAPTAVVLNAAPESGAALSIDAVGKLRVLQRYLTIISNDYNWISLVVDGWDARSDQDLSTALESTEESPFDDGAKQYLDYTNLDDAEIPPVDLRRAYLPVESLKARIYWLERVSVNSDGAFRITEGTFDCLAPALNASSTFLNRMVPAVREEGDTVSYIADTACAMYTDDDPETPCLYALLQTQADLLSLLQLDPETEK